MDSPVFISYAHKDRKWLMRMLTVMDPLVRARHVKLWADTDIRTGAEWHNEIISAISSAKIAILLVTQDYLASKFVQEVELPLIMKAAKEGSLAVYWIPISSALHEATPLSAFQAASNPARPLETLRVGERNRELARIAGDLWQVARAAAQVGPADEDGHSGAGRPGGADPASRVRLPILPNPTIGRDEEVVVVERLITVGRRRVVTLAGPPGVGKTRLAIEVAGRCKNAFEAGVWFLPLAHVISDHSLPGEILLRLGLQEAGKPAIDTLRWAIGRKRMLLVLDNFEQIDNGASIVSDLIETCPEVQFLVTSRAPLKLSSEQVFGVSPLQYPPAAAPQSMRIIRSYPAIQLFVERASARQSSFSLTRGNMRAIVQICRALDGLPLAIELAAGRIAMLSPQDIVKHLPPSLAFLVGGATDLPLRSQTLRQAIAWSYGLLRPEVQTTLRRLGVFVGGFSLSMADLIARDSDDFDILDHVGNLIDQSLLVASESSSDARFLMLETIREFALDALDESAEADAIHLRHAQAFLALAERAESELRSSKQTLFLAQLELEHPNFRGALAWCNGVEVPAGKGGVSEAAETRLEILLRLTSALGQFWYIRGHFAEGREWLERAVDLFTRLGLTCVSGTQEEKARDRSRWLAQTMHWSGYLAYYQNDLDAAGRLFSAGLRVYRDLGDVRGVALELGALGRLAYDQGDVTNGHALQAESLRLFRMAGDRWGTAWSIGLSVRELISARQFDEATELLSESIALRTESGDSRGLAWSLHQLGVLNLSMDRNLECKELFVRALRLRMEIGDRRGLANSFHDCGRLACAMGKDEIAVRLFALADNVLAEIGGRLPETEERQWKSDVDSVRKRVSASFDTDWKAGTLLPVERALKVVLAL